MSQTITASQQVASKTRLRRAICFPPIAIQWCINEVNQAFDDGVVCFHFVSFQLTFGAFAIAAC